MKRYWLMFLMWLNKITWLNHDYPHECTLDKIETWLKKMGYQKNGHIWIKGFVDVEIESNNGVVNCIHIGHDMNKRKQTIFEHIVPSLIVAERYYQNI